MPERRYAGAQRRRRSNDVPNRHARVIKLTVSFGFYGKIPSRGDFVRSGLPRPFIDAWDGWLQHVMAESRVLLGDAWLPAWMEAPVWRFSICPGVCGPGAALGLFMPSVDRAGRHFPLTLACVRGDRDAWIAPSLGWLGQAAAAGIDAVSDDLEPDILAERLPQPDMAGARWHLPTGRCAWSTDGSPLVRAQEFATDTMPDGALFARMLDEVAAGSEARGR
jgi:type VI secretion system protein ImpM